MSKVKVAYQLYSAREEAAKDLPRVLKELKAQGYEGVEFAGFYGHSAETIRGMLKDAGLVAASSHVAMQLIREDPFGVISYHQAIGCKYIAIPYLETEYQPGKPGFASIIRLMYSFGKLCRKAGIQLCYHNHDFEFEPVSGGYGLDFLYEAVPENLLKTQMDTCWVKYAGVDPAAYLLKYKGRAPLVHLKDFVGFKGDKSPYHLIGQKENPDANIAQFSYRPYGYGVQDVESLTKAAIEAGAKWLIIEEDESPDRPPLEASRMSIETLRKLGV